MQKHFDDKSDGRRRLWLHSLLTLSGVRRGGYECAAVLLARVRAVSRRLS
jgi:hypothetical protein